MLDLDQDTQALETFSSDVENAASIWLPPKTTNYDWQAIAAKYADREVDWEQIAQYASARTETMRQTEMETPTREQQPEINDLYD